ncbi:lipocalin-like domain-containing protein [Flavihumibacter petaseus]|uniref:Uncharacterized protein n=1 Tax=Flavihumibacter petaseus NBRC 106054 TaxID=1220578 RepID=A0A0E9N012_9BACT|nr:glycoside hydrolase family 43 C-terminal domain-containing protein [Flavihumibacter petaseus]GAO43128.1 hypothetical protein FPE01S_02_02320 [Flavihumibacter petaseus NBRC 106054]
MKGLLTALFFCLAIGSSKAQTSKELIGKWKLVKETKNGNVTTPKDTYQVFMEDGVFHGIKEDKSRKGKWKLSEDNTKLTISISIVSIKFTVDYFDAKKRIISSSETGTLEYEKVEE